jgi:membrane associated rhomboid family serine protease
MTATSVLAPSAAQRSSKTLQRAALWAFVIVAFVALAFAAGRASVNAHHASPAIAPTSIAAHPAADASADTCRIRRGPC